jgi:hypothetical protein
MPLEASSDLKFELGHVLFIDIVGYSKLSIDEQSRVLRDLNEIVQTSERFRQAEAGGTLIRLPTGDGMALVFRDSPETPVQCALDLSKALRHHPKVAVR